MKAVPKVNTDGLYIEDTLVDDAFYGVVPFYADPPETETDIEAVDEQPEIAGYIVGVPVPQGLYRPRFDLLAWEAREEDEQTDPSGYWTEGLSPEEIEALTKPQPVEPTPTDLLGEELTAMKLQNIQQQQTIGALGAELAATKLEVIKLKGVDQV